MARFRDPTLFSSHFGVEPETLSEAGLIDPFIDVDVPLFIDPVLLQKSANKTISEGAFNAFREHFTKFTRLLAISKAEGDPAWKAAKRLLNLREPPENGLGYSGGRRSGTSRPNDVRDTIMRTSKTIVELGSIDPEMISLMGFFEENVGADTISDLTTRVIIDSLCQITHNFCLAHGIEIDKSSASETYMLPLIADHRGNRHPIILVPRDIVRELPIANDWSDIERAAMETAQIRDRVNELFGSIVGANVAERKEALKNFALKSADDFETFVQAVKNNVEAYDPNLDALGYYRLKDILFNGYIGLKQDKSYNFSNGAESIFEVVIETIEMFKHHVEHGNLWEELWIGDKPKKERASQLIYYAMSDAFCRANNIDISPEASMGGGPVDFKFSTGYNARVLVEIKRSTGTVVHGYSKQLEFYKNASQTQFAVFVIIDYGDLGSKLREIQMIKAGQEVLGQRASEIVVINAKKKLSASKRE